jgi:hypothetical protein
LPSGFNLKCHERSLPKFLSKRKIILAKNDHLEKNKIKVALSAKYSRKERKKEWKKER